MRLLLLVLPLLLTACQGLTGAPTAPTDPNRYDFDGDGLEDLAVGAKAFDGNRGAVYVFLGSDSPHDRSDADADVAIEGDVPWQFFGSSLTGCDFDADGHGDLVVGGGGLRVYFGGPEFGQRDWADLTADSETIGEQVVCGDVTGDGISDIVALDAEPLGIHVLPGGPERREQGPALPVNSSRAFIAPQADVRDLDAVDLELGDLDADGILDLIVGSSNLEVGGVWGAGAVGVHLGGDSLTGERTTDQADFVVLGEAEGTHLGRSLAVVDLDDSGTTDLAIGTMAGELRLFRGGPSFTGVSADQVIRRPELAIADPVWSATVQRPWRHDLAGPVLQVRARLDLDGDSWDGAVFLTGLLSSTPPRCMGVVSETPVRLADATGALRVGDEVRWLMGAPGTPSADRGQVFAVAPDALGLEAAAPCHDDVAVVRTSALDALELSGPKSFGAALGN